MEAKIYLIEIATTDYVTTAAAVEGGADRIELCAALSEGGITPSFGLIRKCRKAFDVALFPIIRCRAGDFLYSDAEYELMMQDALLCKQLGCNGVVTGFLKRDGSIDKEKLTQFVAAVYPLEVTFHRAFDRCRDPFEALENIIEAGCQRILTSGQQLAAPDGAGLIKKLVEAADNRIVIMPGSGVRPGTIKALAQNTGAVEFHASLRNKKKSDMGYIHPAFAISEESYYNSAIDVADVQALHKALVF